MSTRSIKRRDSSIRRHESNHGKLYFLSNKKWKYLVLLPLFVLIMNAFCFNLVIDEVRRVAYDQRISEATHAVDTLAAAVEADVTTYPVEHESNLVNSVTFIDGLYNTFGALYTMRGGNIIRITEPLKEEADVYFDPFINERFKKDVFDNDSGNFTLSHETQQGTVDMYIYFRWMPSHSVKEHRYLVVTGVSVNSVVADISMWISLAPFFNTIITLALIIWEVALITKLGYIYDIREGPNKWRVKEENVND